MSEAADYALSVGIDVAHERAFRLAARLREGIASIDGVRELDPGCKKCAIVTLSVEGMRAADTVSELSRRGFNSSLTLQWYGLIDLASRGIESAVRLSPHYYNSEGEIDSVLGALKEIVKTAIP